MPHQTGCGLGIISKCLVTEMVPNISTKCRYRATKRKGKHCSTN